MNRFISFVVLIFCFGKAFPQANEIEYNYANGTILNQYHENNNFIVIRKHEQRFSTLANFVDPSHVRYGVDEIIAYEKPNKNSKELFKLKYGDYVNTMQVANVKNMATGNESSWIQIKNDNNRIGWLALENRQDVYHDGTWSIMEQVDVNGKRWTVRKLNQSVSVKEVLNVRDNPGVNGTKVLFKLIPPKDAYPIISVTVLAITEETDTIDGITDYWLKIEYENRVGWIFGGYAGVERGGPKYFIPDSVVDFYIYFKFTPP